jgi:hypothetical protein
MLAYRYLTGEDTSAFCHKVSQALDTGWSLYGEPSYAYDAKEGMMRCAQAVVKEVDGRYDPGMKLGSL